MRSSKEAAAEAARSNYFTATARKPFYVKKLDTPPQRMKMKKYKKKKIKKDPETVVVPWMRPQPVAHEQRKALEKEDELKRKLKLDILKVEKFYATTLKNLEKVEDLELKRAIRASVAMGEQEIAVLKKRVAHHRYDLKSLSLLKKYRKKEQIADRLIDKAQKAPNILMGKMYLEHASREYNKAGALEKSLSLKRFWASQDDIDDDDEEAEEGEDDGFVYSDNGEDENNDKEEAAGKD